MGSWTSAGQARESPLGPAGEVSGRDVCRWMPGKFFVTCRLEHKGPMGAVMALGVMGYDPVKKVYTSSSFNSIGRAESATGILENGTWTWSSDRAMDGKLVKSKIVMSDTTPSGYKFRWETSENGKTWKTMMNGTVTKQSAKRTEARKQEER